VIAYTVNLGGLTFSETSADYQLVDQVQPAERTRRRVAVTAPHVAGDFELSSVADAARLRMTIRCYGGASNPQTLVDAVVTAIEQDAWTLAVTWDGATRSWAANAADWSCPIEGQGALVHRRDITIVVPVQPYPS
jgi:hypothetical protein